MMRRSLESSNIENQLGAVKMRVSTLLKKRKRMSTLIKSFEIEKLSEMLKLQVAPSEFSINGEKLDRSKTELNRRFPKLNLKTQRRTINQEEEDPPSILTPKPSMDRDLSITLKRVLRSKNPCQHSISSYYPAISMPDRFSVICNLQKRKQKRKGFAEFKQASGDDVVNRSKKHSIRNLTESSPLIRSKSVTLQYQQMKRYFQQKYCKQK